VFTQALDDEGRLHCQLTSGHEHESLNLVQLNVDSLDDWDGVGCSLSRSVLGFGENVLSKERVRDRFFLNRGRELESHFVDAL